MAFNIYQGARAAQRALEQTRGQSWTDWYRQFGNNLLDEFQDPLNSIRQYYQGNEEDTDTSDEERPNIPAPTQQLVRQYRNRPRKQVAIRQATIQPYKFNKTLPLQRISRTSMVYSTGSKFKRKKYYGGGRSSYRRYYRRPSRKYKPSGMSGRRIIKICDTFMKRRMEKKYHISDVFTNNPDHLIAFTAPVYSILDIPQGSTDTTRVGDKAWISSIQIKFEFRMYPKIKTTGTEGTWVVPSVFNFRIIVFQWLDNDSFNTPSVIKILNDTDDMSAYWNHDNGANYWIMHDQQYTIGTFTPQKNIQLQLKPKNKRIDYVGGGTGGTNKVFWCCLANRGAYYSIDGTNANTENVPFQLNVIAKATFYDS